MGFVLGTFVRCACEQIRLECSAHRRGYGEANPAGLVEALLAAWLLSRTRLAGYASRVGFVFVVGLTAAITTNIPYWNWYGFPASYTMANITIQLVGFLIIGLVAAAVMKQPLARAAAL